MAALVVADSGFVLASTVYDEPHSAVARNLMVAWKAQTVQLAAPVLLRYELTAVVRKWLYRGRVTSEEAPVLLQSLLNLHIEYHVSNTLLQRAYELATQLNLATAYDAQYLAVAERLNCEFWTADQKLFNAASGQLAWVKWVGNFK